MPRISLFDVNRYSEELYGYTEQEYDDVMRQMVEGAERIDAKYPVEDFEGYDQYSRELEASGNEPPASENFIVRDGKVYHKPEPPSIGRLNGYEL